MRNPDIERLAAALASARREGVPLDPTGWQTVLPDQETAYAAQAALAREMGWFAGGPPRAWKSGGPARTQVLTHAPLPPEGVREAPVELGDLRFFAPLIEIEIALRLAREVSAETAVALAAQAGRTDGADRVRLAERVAADLIDAMCVSIEVVDSRWADPARATAAMKLADLQSHGALVLGEWIPYRSRDWSAQRCEVRIGDAMPVQCTGTHPLGSPVWPLPVWLGHAVAWQGRSLAAGTVVTTGAWAGMLPGKAGDEVVAKFDGIGSTRLRL